MKYNPVTNPPLPPLLIFYKKGMISPDKRDIMKQNIIGGIWIIMIEITFDDSLITGNETIDTQHKELIDRIRNFVSSCEKGDGKIKAIQMLDYLAEYTNYHFNAEEKLQEDVNYPGLKEHRDKHEEFKTNLDALYDFFEEAEGPTDSFVEQVKINVVDWLFHHIKTFDRSVAEFIYIRENPSLL